MFLVADTQLYKRLCPSVRPLVGRSVTTSRKVRKRAFPPLPIRPQLVAVYPALFSFFLIFFYFFFLFFLSSLSIFLLDSQPDKLSSPTNRAVHGRPGCPLSYTDDVTVILVDHRVCNLRIRGLGTKIRTFFFAAFVVSTIRDALSYLHKSL